MPQTAGGEANIRNTSRRRMSCEESIVLMEPIERVMGLCVVCGKQRMLSPTSMCNECEQLIGTLERENLLSEPNPEFINERLLRILLKSKAKDAS